MMIIQKLEGRYNSSLETTDNNNQPRDQQRFAEALHVMARNHMMEDYMLMNTVTNAKKTHDYFNVYSFNLYYVGTDGYTHNIE